MVASLDSPETNGPPAGEGHHAAPLTPKGGGLEWREIMDGLGVGVFVLDGRQQFVFGNRLYREMTGHDIVECGGVEAWLREMCPEEKVAENTIASWRHHIWRNQLTRTYPLTAADGRTRQIEFRASEGPGDGLVVTMRDVTQENQAEERLREGKMKFRAVFGHSSTGIVLTDPTGRIVDVNPAFVQFSGISLQELRLTPFASLLHPNDAERLKKKEDDLLSQSRTRPDDSVKEKVALRTRDGQRVTEVTYCPVGRKGEGRALGIYLFNTLADRKAMEAARAKIAELSAKAGALLNAVPDLLLLLDRECRIVDFSPPSKPWEGMPVSPDSKGLPAREVWPAFGSLLDRTASRVFDEGKSVSATFRPAGDAGSYLLSFSPFGEGQALAVVRNQSGLRRLEESEAQLRTAVEATGDMVLFADAKGVIREANPAARRRFGIGAEGDGRGLAQLLCGRDESAKAVQAELSEVLRSEGEWRCEKHLARPDGTDRVRVSVRPVSHRGVGVALVAVVRPVDEESKEDGAPSGSRGAANECRLRDALQTVTSLFSLEPGGSEARDAFLKWQVRLRALSCALAGDPGAGIAVGDLVRTMADETATILGRGPGYKAVSVDVPGDLRVDSATAVPFSLLAGEIVRLALAGEEASPGPSIRLEFVDRGPGRILLRARPGHGGRLFPHAQSDEAGTLDLLSRQIRGILRTRVDEEGESVFELTFRSGAA